MTDPALRGDEIEALRRERGRIAQALMLDAIVSRNADGDETPVGSRCREGAVAISELLREAEAAADAIDDLRERLAKAEGERDAEKRRQHREFWDVEKERQAVCLAVEHHANSGTPVSFIVREKMAELSAAEARALLAESKPAPAAGDVREALESAAQRIEAEKSKYLPGGPFDVKRLLDHLAKEVRALSAPASPKAAPGSGAPEGALRLVILESPYAGDVDQNVAYARACLRDSLQRGEAPLASHLLYTQPGVLNDVEPDERAMGISAGLEWGALAQATVVYTDRGVSPGMEYGIEHAHGRRPVEFRQLGGDWTPDYAGRSVRQFLGRCTEKPPGIVVSGYIDSVEVMLLEIEFDGGIFPNVPLDTVTFSRVMP